MIAAAVPAPRLPGRAVLVVPVRELEDVVRERTAHHDATFLGVDDAFCNAHITLLGPWLDDPDDADLASVGAIAESTPPFDVTLGRVREFPDGLLYLAPEPDAGLRSLTAALMAAFPQCPPYGGAFPEPTPHLTIEHRASGLDADDVRALLGDRLPVTSRVERIDLQWWANDDCHVRASWRLG